MITEAELSSLLIYQTDRDDFRRIAGIPTLEEGVLNLMEIEDGMEAMRDPFPLPPEEFARMWFE